jgi:hypothetical protein
MLVVVVVVGRPLGVMVSQAPALNRLRLDANPASSGATAPRSLWCGMRFSAGTVANAAAWAVLAVLIAVAFVTVNLLGPAGLVILGLFVLFICTAVNLYVDAPTWGTEVFKARIASPGSPEQRAAVFDEKRVSLSPIRFYRWCGVVLVIAGATGFIWQQVR